MEEEDQSRGRGHPAGGWVEKHTRILVGAPAVDLEGSALAENLEGAGDGGAAIVPRWHARARLK
jgi:hypothetical protein